MLTYAYIRLHTLTYAFIRFHMLSYGFTCFYMLLHALIHKLSPPQEEEEDRWSQVNRLFPAEAGKNWPQKMPNASTFTC